MSHEVMVLYPESQDKLQVLGGLSTEKFLSNYCKRNPFWLNGLFPALNPFISWNELAELACSKSVESRLVIEKKGEYLWQVIQEPHGRLATDSLPESHWTLLVHNVELLQGFQFHPKLAYWRFDDKLFTNSQ